MSYAKLQFIAYVLNTAPVPPQVAPVPANPYYPGLPDQVADIDARVALVERALATAATEKHLGGADTLKVFMLPEFAFRGAAGAYDMDSVHHAIAGLQALANDAAWTDWLFVFGTIVAGVPTLGAGGSTDIYNFSLVQRGGLKRTAADAYIVVKELISNIDFIADDQINTALPLASPGLLLASEVRTMQAGAQGMGQENQAFNYDGSGIFDCAGIRFGMEVCLDHQAKRLVASPQIPGDTQVQVQMVTSCGMSLKRWSLILDPSGYAFTCDGIGNGAGARWPLPDPGKTLALASPQQPMPVAAGALDVKGAATVEVGTLYRSSQPAQKVALPLGVCMPGSAAGAVVVFAATPVPPQLTVPGTTDKLQWYEQAYLVEVVLIYDASGAFTGASGRITSPDSELNDLPRMLPMTVQGVDIGGRQSKCTMTYTSGAEGYNGGIEIESNLAGMGLSGLQILFSRTRGAKPSKLAGRKVLL